MSKVLKPGPDRTVQPEKPRTVQFYGLFRVKNRSIQKKQGPARTAVRPSGSVNRDRFLRFGWFLFVSAFPMNLANTPVWIYDQIQKKWKNMKRTKIGRRSDNFRSWTKRFVRKKKKKEPEIKKSQTTLDQKIKTVADHTCSANKQSAPKQTPHLLSK